MKAKKLLTFAMTFLSLFLIFFFVIRINGFFVRFQATTEVENFLLENLEINASTMQDVEAFMENYTGRLESCSISTIPNRRNGDDDALSCKVLSHTTWMFFPVTQYYTIDFYFTNAILKDITVGRWFMGV